jgi:hypothetical protein
MLKTKTILLIFAICFVAITSIQYMRVAQYGLYGSKEQWDKTISIPDDINSSNEIALRNLLIQGENEGWIICFPEQKTCHYTGKGVYDYGAFSKFMQSSDYLGWFFLIMQCALQALLLMVLIGVGFEVIHKYNK